MDATGEWGWGRVFRGETAEGMPGGFRIRVFILTVLQPIAFPLLLWSANLLRQACPRVELLLVIVLIIFTPKNRSRGRIMQKMLYLSPQVVHFFCGESLYV